MLPIKPGGKRPALGEWATYAQRIATPDEQANWWPDARAENGVGVICGPVSGNLFVLDFDVDGAYEAALETLPWLTEMLTIKTGRGYHIYMRSDEYVGATFILKHADFEGVHHVKSANSYVVAPPSLHPSGATYHIIEGGEFATVDPVVIVQGLLAAGFARATTERADRTANFWDDLMSGQYGPGQRNDTLIRLVGVLRAALGSEAMAYELAASWQRDHFDPPLSDEEVRKTVHALYMRRQS